jgi:hypothetical protein
MARDARFFYELGLEHGYRAEDCSAGDWMSYPDQPPYVQGCAMGRELRGRILGMTPGVQWGTGDRALLVFRYALHGLDGPSLAALNPRGGGHPAPPTASKTT